MIMINLDNYNSAEQGTLDWHRARLGKFNASAIHNLMVSGRSKNEPFGKTALAYLQEIAAERLISQDVLDDDNLFAMYLDQNSTTNKAMQWGKDNEEDARELYAKRNGVDVVQVGSIDHPEIPYFACSSDGLIPKLNGGIEVKCPNPKTFVAYFHEMNAAEDVLMCLKKIKPEYYWQIQAQIDIIGLNFIDWVIYCPFLKNPIQQWRIRPNSDDILMLHERIEIANEYINQIITDLWK